MTSIRFFFPEVLPLMQPSPARVELTFNEQSEYLHARISAPFIDRAAGMWYLGEIFLECANRRKKKLLLERDIPYMMPQDELVRTMDHLVSMQSGTRIAFLNSHASIAEELKQIIEYGAEQGATFRYFETFEEAEQWLLNDEA